VLAALAGAAIVLVFDRYTKDLEYGESDAFADER
jgi:hypothetical protein